MIIIRLTYNYIEAFSFFLIFLIKYNIFFILYYITCNFSLSLSFIYFISIDTYTSLVYNAIACPNIPNAAQRTAGCIANL